MEGSRSIDEIVSTKQLPFHGLQRHILIGKKEYLTTLDPFIMWMHDSGSQPAKFPDHPHRGVEGITYAVDEGIVHEDSLGDKEKLEEGGAIYINAGKGIIHTEAPGFKDRKSNFLTLWCYLDKANRMNNPQEHQFKSDEFPVLAKFGTGISVKVLAGKYQDEKGPLNTINDIKYLDVKLDKNKQFTCNIPAAWNCAIYVYAGKAKFGEDHKQGQKYDILTLKNNNSEYFEVKTEDEQCRFFVLAGKPIGEEIVHEGFWYGSTEQEIKQAEQDYKNSKNGFEKHEAWHSDIGKEMLDV
jgi:redox-sensitive bicupin YhaK (pirin superfamily)